jgi:site-specific recombinase XerD
LTSLPALSPGGDVQDNNALPLSEAYNDALAAARGYALAEKSDATRRAYQADWTHFASWCARQGTDVLPASIATVAAYLASLAGDRKKVSTIDRRAAAIAYGHRLAGFTPPTHAEPVKAVLRGIRRRTGVAVERKAPATARAISSMLKRIDTTTLRGKRDAALLLIGFAAALRRSELTKLNVADIERTDGGIFLHIRRSKTDQDGAGHAVPIPRGSRLRPVEALDTWLDAAAITEGPLFRPIRRGGHVQVGALTDHAVARIVKARAKAANLDPTLFSGHSLRAGFVTSALEAGSDVLRVMDITRHTSVQTLKGYDRRAKAFQNHAGGKFL